MLAQAAFVDWRTLQTLLMEREERLRILIRSRLTPDLRSALSEDDVLQEVWLVVFRKISTFLPEGMDSFDRWLTSVTIRSMISLVKDANRMKRGGRLQVFPQNWAPGSSNLAVLLGFVPEGRTPSREAFAAEASRYVQDALSLLSPERQRVISMRYLEGKSLNEIAHETGRTKQAVRSLVYQGIRQMKEELGHASAFFSDAATTGT